MTKIEPNEFRRLISALIKGTDQDKILWENTMLNIHQTVLHGKKIITECPQDDPPLIIIGDATVQIRLEGIESLNKYIDEQYKRLKKYRYSEATQSAQARVEANAEDRQSKNNREFNTSMNKLLDKLKK